MIRRPVIVTTSWDDGAFTDLRIAELLKSAAVSGTFYVPLANTKRPVIGGVDIRCLHGAGFEIGAHGASHRDLPGLPPPVLTQEVEGSKRCLEDILGAPVWMFCYPRGRHDTNVRRAVRLAGYAGARTTRMLQLAGNADVFAMPTTIQAFPHPVRAYIKNLAKARNIFGLYDYLVNFRRSEDWVQLGRRLFDFALEHGGIWHLYGHSWEIEEFDLWNGLTNLLEYVQRRDGVLYLANHDTLRFSQMPGGCAEVTR